MINLIKKWLGIKELQDTLTAPEKGYEHIGGEIDLLDHKIDEIKRKMGELEERGKRCVDCFNCGVIIRLAKAIPFAVLKKDVQESGVLSEYNLFYAIHSLSGDREYKEPSQTIYFCKNCPAKLPVKPKSRRFSTFA